MGLLQDLMGAFQPKPKEARFETPSASSLPTEQLQNNMGFDLTQGWLKPNQYYDPYIFDMYNFMADNIPDISCGIWAWTALCATAQSVQYINGTPEQIDAATGIIKDLAMRIFPIKHTKNLGMDGIAEQFFRSTFTLGSFAAELVLSRRRKEITKMNIINPATIRFKRIKNSYALIPYQVPPDVDRPSGLTNFDKFIELNPNTFYYYGLSQKNDNPYGTSLLSAIPFVANIQHRMMNDMEKTMHNAGYPRYHVKFTPPKQNAGESVVKYLERIKTQFNEMNTLFKAMPPDANFISYDNIQVIVLDAAGKISIEWYNNHRAITEQVISGMKLAPFMIGKNFGTADQWATSQYDLILRNAGMVQRAAKRMIEWIYNLELMLKGSPVRTIVSFKSNRSAGEQLQNQADDMKFTTIIKKRDEGIISQEQAAIELGYDRPFLPGPNEDIMWIKSQAYTKKVNMNYNTEPKPGDPGVNPKPGSKQDKGPEGEFQHFNDDSKDNNANPPDENKNKDNNLNVD